VQLLFEPISPGAFSLQLLREPSRSTISRVSPFPFLFEALEELAAILLGCSKPFAKICRVLPRPGQRAFRRPEKLARLALGELQHPKPRFREVALEDLSELACLRAQLFEPPLGAGKNATNLALQLPSIENRPLESLALLLSRNLSSWFCFALALGSGRRLDGRRLRWFRHNRRLRFGRGKRLDRRRLR
jgi:hypothetical protein